MPNQSQIGNAILQALNTGMGAWQQQRQWSIEEPYKRAQVEKIRHEIEQDKRMLAQSEGVLRSLGLLPDDPTGATLQGGITAFPTGTTGGGEPEPFTRQPQTSTENIGGALVGRGAPGVAVTPPGQPVTPTGDSTFQGNVTQGFLPSAPSSAPMDQGGRLALNVAGSINPYLPEDMGNVYYGPPTQSPEYLAYLEHTKDLAKQAGKRGTVSTVVVGVDILTGTPMEFTATWDDYRAILTDKGLADRQKQLEAANYNPAMIASTIEKEQHEARTAFDQLSGGPPTPETARYPAESGGSVEGFVSTPTADDVETIGDLSQKTKGTMEDATAAQQRMTGGEFAGGVIRTRPPLSEKAQEEMRQLSGLFEIMDQIEAASLQVNREDRAVIAPLVGLWQKGLSYAGVNDNAIKLQRLRNAFAGLFARLGGETGRFTEGDIARAQQMVPDLLMKHENTVWLLNMANSLLQSKLVGITMPFSEGILQPWKSGRGDFGVGSSPPATDTTSQSPATNGSQQWTDEVL